MDKPGAERPAHVHTPLGAYAVLAGPGGQPLILAASGRTVTPAAAIQSAAEIAALAARVLPYTQVGATPEVPRETA